MSNATTNFGQLPENLGLSGSELALTRALNLPTFEINQRVFIKRLTMILRQGKIAHVFDPIFPPNAHADEVLTWLSSNAV